MATPALDARFAGLPGAELVSRGLAALAAGEETPEALLVCLAAGRLAALGLHVPSPWPDPEHRLYLRLREEDPRTAHGRYNALVRRLVSFERAAECAR